MGSEFLIIWRMSFLEKWHLTNNSSVSKFDCDGKMLLSAKKSFTIFTIIFKISLFFNQQCTMYLLKFSLSKLILVSYFLKAKDFCTYKKGQSFRIYGLGFIDKHDHVISWNKYFILQVTIFFYKCSFEKELVTFSLFNSCLYISKNDPWIVKYCALVKVEIKPFFENHVTTWSMSHVTWWVRYPHTKSRRL